LKDGSKTNQIYCCAGLERLSGKPGVYIFARKFGKIVFPLYVGQAKSLRSRIEGQFNNLRLMVGIKNAQNGRRILLIGRLSLHRGYSNATKLLKRNWHAVEAVAVVLIDKRWLPPSRIKSIVRRNTKLTRIG